MKSMNKLRTYWVPMLMAAAFIGAFAYEYPICRKVWFSLFVAMVAAVVMFMGLLFVFLPIYALITSRPNGDATGTGMRTNPTVGRQGQQEGRSFWQWLVLWARAGAMAEARKKRIMHENLETWNRENRDFIRKCEREDARRIDQGKFGCEPTADESSTVGFYGSDCGDDGII